VPKRDQIEHSRDGIGLLESPERPGRSCSDPSSCSIHPSAWKGYSRKSACRMLHRSSSNPLKLNRRGRFISKPLQNVVVVDKDARERILSCDLRWLAWHTYELYPRLQYGCSTKPRSTVEVSSCAVGLCCKTWVFRSGPDETRTRDLRHARATRCLRSRS